MLDLIEKPALKVPMTSIGDFLKQKAPDKSVADMLADIFRKRIMEGEFLPGMRLVEAELTKLYGVSRGPVREAIKRLIAENLVEAEKHKSPTVRGVGQAQFREMFEVRAILEAFAAGLAAKRANDTAAAECGREAERWRRGDYANGIEQFVDANTRFHRTVTDLADHTTLSAQIEQLAIPGYKAVFKPMVTPRDMAISARQHADILEAIAGRKPEVAERKMRQHVEESKDRVVGLYDVGLFDRRLRELERIKGE
jgi:DNA-binding GntR family transcriptional regulator